MQYKGIYIILIAEVKKAIPLIFQSIGLVVEELCPLFLLALTYQSETSRTKHLFKIQKITSNANAAHLYICISPIICLLFLIDNLQAHLKTYSNKLI